MLNIFKEIINLSNVNSGFLEFILFISTLLIGWFSGLFKYVNKRPKFKIHIIEYPTFGCTIYLENTHNGLPVHKTAFSIYLEITNIGNAPASIGEITLGYLQNDLKTKKKTKRNWVRESIAKSEFFYTFPNSDKVKVFPFLKQPTRLIDSQTDTYLEIGKTTNGIVYFEEKQAFGSFMPRLNDDLETTDLIIKIEDAFGKIHKKQFNVKMIDPNLALKVNPYFAQTDNEYFIVKNNILTVE